MAGFDLIEAITQLIPGQQSGEMVGGQGIGNIPGLGNIAQAIAALLPGQQSFLGEMPPGYDPSNLVGTGIDPNQIAYSWNTGTAVFYRLTNGKIAVQKKNGTWKVYRPKRHIVIPADPKIGTLLKAHRKVNSLVDKLDRQADASRRKWSRGTTRRATRKVC